MGAEAAALSEELRKWVAEQLGAIARPDDVRLTDNLPKTRSGKIMRRLLRSIARGEEISQDVSTLENPAIIDQLRGDAMPAAAPGPSVGTSAAAAGRPVEPKPPAKRKIQRKSAAPAERAARPKRPAKLAAARKAKKSKRKFVSSARPKARRVPKPKFAARRKPVRARKPK
jgi:hypothetical protein